MKIVKLLISLTILTFVLSVSIPVLASNTLYKLDGHDWLQWDDTIKIGYCIGFMNGSDMTFFNALGIERWRDNINLRDDILNTLNDRVSFSDIPPKQLMDGLTILYADFKNQSIPVRQAILVVRKQIKGTKQEDIERILLYLRSQDFNFIKDQNGKLIERLFVPP